MCDLRKRRFLENRGRTALKAPLKLFKENFLNFGNKFNFMFSDYIFDKKLFGLLWDSLERREESCKWKMSRKFNHVSNSNLNCLSYEWFSTSHRPNWIKFISSNTTSHRWHIQIGFVFAPSQEMYGNKFCRIFWTCPECKIIRESSWEITQRQHELTHERNILPKQEPNVFQVVNFQFYTSWIKLKTFFCVWSWVRCVCYSKIPAEGIWDFVMSKPDSNW